jgi:hypothetical protein
MAGEMTAGTFTVKREAQNGFFWFIWFVLLFRKNQTNHTNQMNKKTR